MTAMKQFNTLDDFQFENKTVLLRVDINCPLDKETLQLTDDNRIRHIVPTVRELLDDGAKIVIIAHQGRPGEWDFTSLEQHAVCLSKYLNKQVKYVDDILGTTAINEIKSLTPGNVIMLKNIRELPYELEKKSAEEHADSELVKTLAPLADYYVNDAFATAHRSQCSLVGPPCVLPSAVGRLMEKELTALSSVFSGTNHPSIFILGGSKFADAIKVMDRALTSKAADMIILVGLTASAFLVARGVDIGEASRNVLNSELTPETLEAAKKLLREHGEHILLPFDVAVEEDGARKNILVGDLPTESPIYDIGKRSIEKFAKVIDPAKTVFMSGPAGLIEKEQFTRGTRDLMTAMAHSDAYTLLGGGHTVGAAERFGMSEKFSYVSTAGGALETFILGKPLPAVEVLRKK